MGIFRAKRKIFSAGKLGDYETQQFESLVQCLRSLNVKIEHINGYERMIKTSTGKCKHVVKLSKQNIDAVFLSMGYPSSEYSFPPHFINYVLFGLKPHSAYIFEAGTRERKEHWYGGKVINVEWIGGPLARSLNTDIDLLQLQI